MKNTLLLILFLYAFAAFSRPSPQKQTAEVLNDIYRSSTDTPSASIDVTLTATSFTTTELVEYQREGERISFTASNVTDSADLDVLTLTSASKKIQIVNNSGGEFYLNADGSSVGVVAPGQESIQSFYQPVGTVISIRSISGTVSTGNFYINSFGN